VWVALLTLGGCQRPGGPLDAQRAAEDVSRLETRFVVTGGGARRVDGERAVAPRPAIGPAVAEALVAVGDSFEPRLPASLPSHTEVRLSLPATAAGAFRLEERASGVSIEVALDGLLPAHAVPVGGYLDYPRAAGGAGALLHRPTADGTEDFLELAARPQSEEVVYHVTVGGEVAGLRQIGGALEFLDGHGAPRLRMSPPYLVGADGRTYAARVALEGCDADHDPAPPWGRPTVAPGASRCDVRIAWSGAGVAYPALLDPSWSSAGIMSTARANHSSTLLANGRVLVVGGDASGVSATADVYDPGSNSWSPTGSLQDTQDNACGTGTCFPETCISLGKNCGNWGDGCGGVIACGTCAAGQTCGTGPNGTCGAGPCIPTNCLALGSTCGSTGDGCGSILNCGPCAAGQNCGGAPITTSRSYHSAVLLQSGHVLVAGGQNASSTPTGNSYEYDPVAGTFTHVGRQVIGRQGFVMAPFSNGQVGAFGGLQNPPPTPQPYRIAANTCEVYDPGAKTWGMCANLMTLGRFNLSGVQFTDGRVFLVGGNSFDGRSNAIENSTEIFTPGTPPSSGTFAASGPMVHGRMNPGISLLLDGRVLVTGGNSNNVILGNVTPNNEGEVWNAGSFGATVLPTTMSIPRVFQVQVTVPTGDVVITGGAAGSIATDLFTAATSAFAPTVSIGIARTGAASTLLQTGQVLVSGGGPASAELLTVALPNGSACTINAGCTSGFCVNGICCNNACNTGTCQTCATGTCNPRAAGFVCRAVAGICDVAETCDGTSATCPPDAFQPAYTICRPTTGPCDVGEVCTGTSATCPPDVTVSQACGTGCSGAAGCGFTDTDGDGLNDTWENNPVPAGIDPLYPSGLTGYVDLNCNGRYDINVDTPLPDSHVNEPDLYVKFDYMVKSTAPTHSHQPSAAAMAMVQTALGNHHTHLHYYPVSEMLAETAVTTLTAPGMLVPACTGPDAISLYTIKPLHFTSNLAPAYHYAVFGHYNTCDSLTDCPHCPSTTKTAAAPPFGASGISEVPGNDFIVSLGSLVDVGAVIPDIINAGTFMHELGHNLGLRHGGNDDFNQKPNYISVMNYSYEFGIGTTAAPGPYPTSTVNPEIAYHIDYSTFAAGTLHQGMPSGSNTCVSDGSGGMSEPAGLLLGPPGDLDVAVFYADFGGTTVYGPSNATPIDWDNTAPATDLNVYADVSGSGLCGNLSGFNDWVQGHPSPAVYQDTNLALGFQCNTLFWADGAKPPSQLEDDEITIPQVLAQHLLYPFLHVVIDVRPGCGTHWIATRGPGTVPVAALGSATFDVTQVVLASVRFAGAAPLFPPTINSDVNGDGVNDLVATFDMTALNLPPPSTTASLTGALASSQAFGGTDTITLVPYPGPVVTLHNDGSGFAATLFPPDHRQISFSLANCADSVIDQCGVPLNVNQAGHIVRITSDEVGDDDMAITSSSTFQLERERNGAGDGRVYTVIFDVTDSGGNTSEWPCRIQVPHDARGGAAVEGMPKECVGTCP
jgi:hypothetical protein